MKGMLYGVKNVAMLKGSLCYDSYTKILHIGKIMIRRSVKFKFEYQRVDASKRPYITLGFVSIRL